MRPSIIPFILLQLAIAAAFADDLSKADAEAAIAREFAALREAKVMSSLPREAPESIQKQIQENKGKLNISVRSLALGGDINMPYTVVSKVRPEAAEKAPLFIAMHGGGGSGEQPGPHTWEVNTSEFQTQIKMAVSLYRPEGIYFVPRMADDRLGRWWHKHNQKAFDQVIDHAVLHWNVDPNRVYILGVSEGGFGADILGPHMADRWAGANAMAAGVGLGNPPANLRNVAFRTDVGERDMMFDRVKLATAFHDELERLRKLDPAGYKHSINIQKGRGHGIDYSQGIQWIAESARNPWPARIVWINQAMDGLRRERFYWLSMPEVKGGADIRIEAGVAGQTINIEAATLAATNTDGNKTHGKDNVGESKRTPLRGARIELLLRDGLLDLDRPITVTANGKQVFQGAVKRSEKAIKESLAKRPDPSACPAAIISITTP